MKIKTAVCSSVGMKRRKNEDNFYINGFINKKGALFVLKSFLASSKEQWLCICDGMGGQEFGEIASLLAVKRIAKYKDKYSSILDKFEEHAQSLSLKANKDICEYMNNNGIKAMGSTIAMLCISPKKSEAIAANIGDSKVYLYRDGEISKLSVDHNSAQQLVDLGMITEEEALKHKSKSKLTQHLGIPLEEMIIEPAISESILLNRKDIFIVCSDGLTDMLTYSDMTEILSQRTSVKEKCKRLVTRANLLGGVDNITVIMCEVV